MADPTGTNLTSAQADEIDNSSPIARKYQTGARQRTLRSDLDKGGKILKANTAAAAAIGASSTSEVDAAVTLVIPANTLELGDRLMISMAGPTAAASTPSLSVKIKVTDGTNTHTICTLSDSSMAASAAANAVAFVGVLTAGSSGKIEAHSLGAIDGTPGGGAVFNQDLDTTVDITIKVTAQFGASNAGNTFTLRELSCVRNSLLA